MSIFEIQLCGKYEYAEHYEHGTEPKVGPTKEIALLERMKSAASADLALALALYVWIL